MANALERGLQVLHCFERGAAALSHQDIARTTGLPKATLSRITHAWVRLGYLDASHADGRFRLTARTLDLGHLYLANVDVRAIAQPPMAQLAEHANATVNLAVRSADHLVVVETVRSHRAVVAINARIGLAFPILQTAMGRAYLAGLEPADREREIEALRPTAAAHEWKSLCAKVRKAVAECESKGCCALFGEWRTGVNSVAAPLRAGSDGPLYVMNCAGPAHHLQPAAIETDIAPRLLAIVRQIEREANVSWNQAADAA